MNTIRGAWSREQVETFLGQARVPIRLACHDARDGLWMLSLWYRFRDGQFQCATGAESDIAAYLRADDRVAFEVSTNQPPYMGVRGNGTAALEADENKETLQDLLTRYLGGTDSALAETLLDDTREELRISIEPDRLYTWDFTDQMRDGLEDSPARQSEPVSPKYDTQ